eukprot:TRINITY_DN847_c2_g1_i1.p1 TRINITY_DN847_c2_g1~~TRINITY_DN847_c2_g1_i1.p1  ORF type:complete len:311 (+),score=68.38 TRINITY_DN847_c2_g1_i1:23-955(+)
MPTITPEKAAYAEKLHKLIDEYPKMIIVQCDNVGSAQMQKIRHRLRKEAVVLMGKNTQIRRVLREAAEKNPALEHLVPHIKGNVGFIFTHGELRLIRDKIEELKIDAVAKAGIVAPNDVIVPAGPTGLEPTQTSFLQALFIQSKINKGQVEIVSDVHLIKKGEKVQPSQAALLAKLNIRPFKYGMVAKHIFEDGHVYDTNILDVTEHDLIVKMSAGIANIAAVSLATGYPTLPMVPHSIARAFKNLVACTFATEYTFPLADKIKSAAASAAAAAPVAAAPVAAAKVEKKEEKKEEKEEEAEADMGLDLFG